MLESQAVEDYRYGYPPDKQEKATQTVLEQADCSRGNGPSDSSRR